MTSQPLPPLPPPRDELLQLILRDGILRTSPARPVTVPGGGTAPWMLESLPITLTPRGAELAARCLLPLLARFDGRQLATLGLTAVPIVQACVMASEGRYHGLLVRKARERYGARKRIEGRVDPDEPVIIVDDSVNSGGSMLRCARHLESAGLRVEGGVCLVRFGWERGYSLLRARGYHMAAVYDIWTDVIPGVPGETALEPNPSRTQAAFSWGATHAPEGLCPTELARYVMSEFLREGHAPLPPAALDHPYDAAGGAYVSVRDRADPRLRHAREGFWVFPGERPASVAHDLVIAAVKSAQRLASLGPPGAPARLDASALAVTFLSALEPCTVGALDNDLYGIVVRSAERSYAMGGALPRMPGIHGTWQQFEHARRTNARLAPYEPYELFRHRVTKHVEPGVAWPPEGVALVRDAVPWDADPARAGRVALRARALALAHLGGEPALPGAPSAPPSRAPSTALPGDLIPDDVESVYVTVYLHGRQVGCMGCPVAAGLEAALATAVARACATGVGPGGDVGADRADALAVAVALLHTPNEIGDVPPAGVAPYVAHGRQALMVHQGARVGLLLPSVAVTDDLDPVGFALEVVDRAGITRPPYAWCAYECAQWLADARAVRQLNPTFPAPEPCADLPGQLARLAELFTAYLLRHQRDDGSFSVSYRPFQHVLQDGPDLLRLPHVGWVLSRVRDTLGDTLGTPGLAAAVTRLLDRLSAGAGPGTANHAHGPFGPESPERPTVRAFTLLALAANRDRPEAAGVIPALGAALWSAIDRHGRFTAVGLTPEHTEALQDYAPGQALLALAAASADGLCAADMSRLRRALEYYRHRFRQRRPWAMLSWQMQAFGRWWRQTRDPAHAGFVFEMADEILTHQAATTGAVINDHYAVTPGWHTALYLEGLGVALGLAADAGDAGRYARYYRACARGYAFLDALVIQPRDAAVLPHPAWALGGLRAEPYGSAVHTDFVQHALSAVLELHPRMPLLSGAAGGAAAASSP